MKNKKDLNNIKRIQKEVNRLKEKLKKAELVPCRGDSELRQKDERIQMLKREIYSLEKEANLFLLFINK
jgi:hypothetical protein